MWLQDQTYLTQAPEDSLEIDVCYVLVFLEEERVMQQSVA